MDRQPPEENAKPPGHCLSCDHIGRKSDVWDISNNLVHNNVGNDLVLTSLDDRHQIFGTHRLQTIN